MWLLYSLIAAVFYAALWVLARASRGLPPSIVLAAQFAPSILLVYFWWPAAPLPWHEPLWIIFILTACFFMPNTSWLMTYAGQRSDIGVIKPLSGLSSITALLAGTFLFGETIPYVGLFGVVIVALGLLLLYHGRMHHWRSASPWIVLSCVLVFGVVGALFRAVLQFYPEPVFITGIFLLPSGIIWCIRSLWTVRSVTLTPQHWLILGLFAVAAIVQEVATFIALGMAPAAYMYTVKRTSIIIASLIGYYWFQEKEVPLWRLIAGSVIVISGTFILGIIH